LSDVPERVSPRPPKIKKVLEAKKEAKAASTPRDPIYMSAITTTLGFIDLMREPLTQNAELGLGPATIFKAVTLQLEVLKKVSDASFWMLVVIADAFVGCFA
jgi:hypothetical protein